MRVRFRSRGLGPGSARERDPFVGQQERRSNRAGSSVPDPNAAQRRLLPDQTLTGTTEVVDRWRAWSRAR